MLTLRATKIKEKIRFPSNTKEPSAHEILLVVNVLAVHNFKYAVLAEQFLHSSNGCGTLPLTHGV